uniref:Patched domain containing 3/pseudo n=2 Tax=Latimeria chalumnae TaxID=7897 RepID=H3AQE2_LATCH
MAGCQTDCVQKPLSEAFQKLGHLVGRNPWGFLLIPLLLAGILGTGFYFYPQDKVNEIEELFVPVNAPVKAEKELLQRLFPSNDSVYFSSQRLSTEGIYVSLIAVSRSDNILTEAAFGDILKLDRQVKDLSLRKDNTSYDFSNLCVKSNLSCYNNLILNEINYNASQIESKKFTYPVYKNDFMGLVLGGVKVNSNSVIEQAKAFRLDYYLRDDEEHRNISIMWLHKFVEEFPSDLMQLDIDTIEVSYYTSISRQQEFEVSHQTVIPLFSMAYSFSVLFSVLPYLRFDCVKNKVWVVMFGVISAGLSLLASFGLLLYCGVPFAITIANSPFLILGIGVDDVFVIISCWQQTKVKSKVEERLAETYAEAAVPITITTLTDIFAFYSGIMTPYQSVKSFCIYTGTAVFFCFLYNITFFGAILAINGKREEENKHWLTCMKVDNVSRPGHSKAYNVCCAGGIYDEATGLDKQQPINVFFKRHYGPFLLQISTKVFVVLLYTIYLTISIYGCLQIKEGMDYHNMADDKSYIMKYYDFEGAYFSEYGPRIMVAVTDKVEYWDQTVQENIEKCMKRFENYTYVDKSFTESWLRVYKNASNRLLTSPYDKAQFMSNLPHLFQPFPMFEQDISIANNTILASRFFIQTANIASVFDEKSSEKKLREIGKECSVPLLVYHPAFLYDDQHVQIVQTTIESIVMSIAVMLVISLLLIPNAICSLCATFAVVSILAGVAGFMAFWAVNLDSMSMVNLVSCIGFSVDFSVHISYAFSSNRNSNVNEKIIDSLHCLGYPFIQRAVATILGVAVLSAAECYIFRCFFKIMFLVMFFGSVHGLIFIPVFLTFLADCCKAHDKTVKVKMNEKKV